MISLNIETVNSYENLPLSTSLIKFDATIAKFKILLNIAVLEERLNKTDIRKSRPKVLSYSQISI